MQRLAEGWRREGKLVGFVPTMGYLHEGHLSLVKKARQMVKAEGVVAVSIFVNPLQFMANEDLANYPRDLQRDLQLCRAAGVDIVHVPYKGGGQVITDAAGGQFELFTSNPSPGVSTLLAQGRMRVIAVAAAQRLPAFPNAPTMIELGYPDSNLTSQFGVFAPGRTPEAVVRRLNAEINKALAAPDMIERLTKLENIPSPASVEQFTRTIRTEYEANARIVARAGIRVD